MLDGGRMNQAYSKSNAGDVLPLVSQLGSDHPLWVTQRGLRQLAGMVHELQRAREQALLADDAASVAHITEDLRHWQRRLKAARLVEPSDALRVRFGVAVTLRFDNGVQRCYTLVGEDEADPASGLISWISTVAQALLGHEVGETVALPGGAAHIVAVQLPD